MTTKNLSNYIKPLKQNYNQNVAISVILTSYFNKLFFKQMLQAVQNDNYAEIFTTDLYNKNGCTYCALLGILNNLTDEVML